MLQKTKCFLVFWIIILLFGLEYNLNHKTVYKEKEEANFTSESFTCKQSLWKYRSITLSDKVLRMIAGTCYGQGSSIARRIVEKQFLEGIYENKSCPEIIPRFLSKSSSYVALASFPGSGNTWTRTLLETITGIHTGSLYPDLMSNFTGSTKSPCKAGVFIVKTHERTDVLKRGECTNSKFSSAIYILRNPYDAIMATYNLANGGKTTTASRKYYNSTKWRNFVTKWTELWKEMNLYWMKTFARPVHVLVYENLTANTMFEIYKTMNFLNLNVTLQQLYCLVNKLHTKYYRADKPDWLDKRKLYSQEMKKRVNSAITSVSSSVNSSEYGHILNNYML